MKKTSKHLTGKVIIIIITYVDSLKKSGAFTKEAQEEAFERTKLLAATMINQSAKEIITEAYGDFNTWITTQIEATVKSTKK